MGRHTDRRSGIGLVTVAWLTALFGFAGTAEAQSATSAQQWSVVSSSSAVPTVDAVSCPQGTGTCVMIGQEPSGADVALWSVDSGATYQPSGQSFPAAGSLSGLACPDADHCYVALNTSSGAVLDGQAPLAKGSVASISCPTSTDCFAAGRSSSGAALLTETTDATAATPTWSSSPLPSGADLTSPISCPTANS